MDKWGEIDEPLSEEDMWGGDISDRDDDERGGEGGDYKTEVTFDQKMHSSEINTCGSLIMEEPGKKDDYRKAMAALSPIERIKMSINKIIYTFKEEGVIELSSNQRNKICNSVDNVSTYDMNPIFLNPLAFLLGYLVCRKNIMITDDEKETPEEIERHMKRRIKESKGKKISEEEKETKDEEKRRRVREKKAAKFFELFGNVQDSFQRLQEMNNIAGEYAVYAPDVIRYGQLWLKIGCDDAE